MSTLKNWWLQISTVLLIIMDLGFEVINPLLEAFGMPDNWILRIKVIFGLIALIISKIQLPTQDVDKLIQKIGGTNPPPVKDEK